MSCFGLGIFFFTQAEIINDEDGDDGKNNNNSSNSNRKYGSFVILIFHENKIKKKLALTYINAKCTLRTKKSVESNRAPRLNKC